MIDVLLHCLGAWWSAANLSLWNNLRGKSPSFLRLIFDLGFFDFFGFFFFLSPVDFFGAGVGAGAAAVAVAG